MEKFDVTNLKLLKYLAVPFVLFWVLSLAATFNFLPMNNFLLIAVFILLILSLLGFSRWQKGNKITLTKTELIIHDWANGLYYLGTSSKLNEQKFNLEHIKRVIVSEPQYLQEFAKSTHDNVLHQQLILPESGDKSKLSTIPLMYVQSKSGTVHVTNLFPFRRKSITSLLEKLKNNNIEVLDKR